MTDAVTPPNAPASPEEVIPAKPIALAEVQPPKPGEAQLDVQLTLSEIGAITASIQTCVHSGWIRQTSALNVVNSVLRKFHDVKLQYAKDHPA
jgi:hypothetical protein